MSARCTRQDFHIVKATPCILCHKLSGAGEYPELWMACDYHEGFIDGYEAAKEGK